MKLVKLKQRARLLSFLSAFVIVGFVGYQLFDLAFSAVGTGSFSASQLLRIPHYVLLILTVVNALMLLHSIAASDSPFTVQNARRLNRIGWLLIAFEPVSFLVQTVTNRYFPIRLSGGITMTTHQTYGGIFMISGFAVLAVSVVFHYGIELQALSDETL